MKKRILMCNEASFYPTGYGVYGKELLSRLYNTEEFDVAELACYVSADDEKLKDIPWQVYCNKPLNGAKELELYQRSPTAEFGEFTFNAVCLDFKPDFVIDIRDPWAFEYQIRSPFRKFFKHILMPTVDASPQNPEWIDMFGQADAILTYSEFGKKIIEEQSSGINHIGIASPCASSNFLPLANKNKNRQDFNLPTNIYILGTVMRNQRRKLYPDLFRDFRRILDETGRTDLYLYCHTSFPDIGWTIPELLITHDLSTRVLFTYKCKTCKNISSTFFNDAVCQCRKCGAFTNNMIGVGNGVDEPELAKIYNLFDIYVQYANSEGFGMPQLEAAQCGNVLMSVDYSAMESVIHNLRAQPIKVLSYSKECETGCMRAIPDPDSFIYHVKSMIKCTREYLHKWGLEMSQRTGDIYNWDKTAQAWIDYFRAENTYNVKDTWLSPIKYFNSAPIDRDILHPSERATYLIEKVLGRPDLVGKQIWRRMAKDLTYGTTVESAGNIFYFNESHLKDNLRQSPYNYDNAYQYMLELREYFNVWESHREKAIGANNAA